MIRRPDPKYVRIAAIVIAVLLVVLLIVGYVVYNKRESILQDEIAKAKLQAKNKYALNLLIGSAHFTGLRTIDIHDIIIVPQGKDTLLHIKHFDVSIKIWPLLFGKIKLADVELENGRLTLTDLNGVKNFDFLFKHKKDSTETKRKPNLGEMVNTLITQLLNKIPDNLNLRNFLTTYTSDSTKVKAYTPSAIINDGDLKSTVIINDTLATWHFTGTLHPGNKDLNIILSADVGKPVVIPLIPAKYKMKVAFDDISVSLSGLSTSGGETQIKGFYAVHNLVINQPALSSGNITVQGVAIDANFMVGENYIALDSSSTIHLKKISAHPFVKYTLGANKAYALKLNTGWLDAQDVFDSFPGGVFDALEGIQVSGKLNYAFNFNLDTANPDAVQFDSRLNRDNFRIVKYGKTDLTKLNGSFVYTPYGKGKPMPSRVIGPTNPNYTPLDQISPDLRNAVMTAEDPTFYKNNGFVEEATRKSIATDYKQHKFKRGGSTISMQLVKNAYLSREKTLARKIEETLIVWMIVNNNLMTKNRMLEVYFNIIEWGPNVYGISEASHYYFGVTPAELTLGESIFLANIVPKPKVGLYEFLPDGTLRPTLVNYFNSLGRLMAGQYLTKPDTSNAYGYYTVRLKESIRRKVAPVDSAAANKIINSNTDEDALGETIVEQPKKPNFLQRLFGKKDTVAQKTKKQLQDEEDLRIKNIDTAGKTRKQIRQEKRRIKKEESDKKKVLKDKGIL
jgi:hypothetical protein